MMMLRSLSAIAAIFSAVSAGRVTPVQKVVELLTDLKAQVVNEGQNEAFVYDDFACFCRMTTASKSTDILQGQNEIDGFSAEIQEKTALKEQKSGDLKKRLGDEQAWMKDLEDVKARCAKMETEYNLKAADLSKAISSVNKAVAAMETSKPSFLVLRRTLEQSLALAEVLNLIKEPKRKEVNAFMQTATKAGADPSDPGYKYHSQSIIDILSGLLQEFTTEKADVDTEWGKTQTACTGERSGLETQISSNAGAMSTLETDISTLKGEVASARGNLVSAEAFLKDNQLYVKDLTEECETGARDWDQRSQMRKEELSQLEAALRILQDDVAPRAALVNDRSVFLVQQHHQKASSSSTAARTALVQQVRGSASVASPSFLQETTAGGAHGIVSVAQGKRREDAASILEAESRRLQSGVLAQLAARVTRDPFVEVKSMIQQLIERLLHESRAEATKKTWCDEQLGKSRQDRDFRHADVMRLDHELRALELKQEELDAESGMLTQALLKLRSDLDAATAIREQEQKQNLETIKVAKEGVEKVREAITILKVYYQQAARATVLLQASPVEADTGGPGFSGAYKGKQQESVGILGMLEVIASDFDRTVRSTEVAEKRAHQQFVEFDRAAQADLSGKDTRKSLVVEDLRITQNSIAVKMDDLKTAQELMDSALRALVDLKPTCIDTGMSYTERVAKRQEEIDALKGAYCILLPEDQKAGDSIC